MNAGERVAAESLALVGTPFRLHGRNPATGLDCIGLVAVAMRRAGLRAEPPQGYALRNSNIAAALGFADRCDLVAAHGHVAPGDIILTLAGPAQHHLLVASDCHTFVHAHAGLRRVVATPGPLPRPILRRWRPAQKV